MTSTGESQYENKESLGQDYYLSLYFKPIYDEDTIPETSDEIDFSTMLTSILDIADSNKRQVLKVRFLTLFSKEDRENLLNYPYEFLSEIELNKIFHSILYKKCLELLKNEKHHDDLVDYCKFIATLYNEEKNKRTKNKEQ